MYRVLNLAHIPSLPKPIALAIGMFDGVHLGHQYLIKEMKKVGTPVVYTFSNHPSTLLRDISVDLLTPIHHKLDLLESYGVYCTIVQNFTTHIAEMAYDSFLRMLHSHLPFSHIFFGEGAQIGKNREGTPEKIAKLGEKLQFSVHYLSKFCIHEALVSSTEIRHLLKTGQTEKALLLLGHPLFSKHFRRN
jgi:riboflavin kinase/FMN adenylyltransferase